MRNVANPGRGCGGLGRFDYSHLLKCAGGNVAAMSIAGLAAAIMSSQGGLKQLQLGLSAERMNADHGAAIANLVDAAQQNMKSLNNVAVGIGRNLDASA